MIYVTIEISVSDSVLSYGKDVGKAHLELKLTEDAAWSLSLGTLPDDLVHAAFMDYEDKHPKEEKKDERTAGDEGTSE